jgi:hypothetical protein
VLAEVGSIECQFLAVPADALRAVSLVDVLRLVERTLDDKVVWQVQDAPAESSYAIAAAPAAAPALVLL